ncbi:hypothetical protein [Agrobacterium pusense]|uniref:hypothetical protein n=1 Tax=Agrobacterium pusense TaxID=648995 RepID=UPI000D19D2AF|nr:hypothetical protein [Agrobacterium pusense]
MSEQTTENTPEGHLLRAAKAILAYDGMTEFIAAGNATTAYGILTDDLAALKLAVEEVENSA